MNLEEAREYLEFLLNGLRAFHPEAFELEAVPLIYWEGWKKDDFVPHVLNLTQSKTPHEARAVLEGWLSAPEITRNVPLAIIEAAKETKEVAEAPTPEAQNQASEILLAKSSNLAAELEATGQIVPKQEAVAAEAPTTTKPPPSVVPPPPLVTPLEEGAVVLRPLKAVPSLGANVENLANQATESHDDFREQVRVWIKETFPDFTDQETFSAAERFTQRLESAKKGAPTQVATLKALSENPQVLSQEERRVVTDLAKKATEVAEQDRQVIEKALANKIPETEIRQVFEQDNLKYKPEGKPSKNTFVVRKEPFFEKAQQSAIEGKKVNLEESIASYATQAPEPPTATRPSVRILPTPPVITPVEEGSVVLRPLRIPAYSSNVKSLAKEASSNKDEVREKIRAWIRETFPQEVEDKVQAASERFTQRLEAVQQGKPTAVAVLKTIAKDEGVSEDTHRQAAKLLEKTVKIAQEDRRIIEEALSQKVPNEVIEEVFDQDNLEYETISQPTQYAAYVKVEKFLEKTAESSIQKLEPDFSEVIVPASQVVSSKTKIEESLYIKPARRVASLGKKTQEGIVKQADQIRANAQKYIEELTQKVSQTLPPAVVRATNAKEANEISRRTAKSMIERLLNPEKPSLTDYALPENESALQQIIPETTARQEFLTAANEALIAETAEKELLAKAVDKDIVEALYKPTEIELGKTQEPESYPVEGSSLQKSLYQKVEVIKPNLPTYGLLLAQQQVLPSKIQASKIVGVVITKATPKAKTLGEKITFSSVKFIKEVGYEQFAKTQPHEATALKLLSLGIGSKEIASLAEQAQKAGLTPTAENLKNLEQVLRALEQSQPSLARMAESIEVELQLVIQPGQLAASSFILVPSDASYIFAQPPSQKSPIFSYVQSLFEKPAGRWLSRLTRPAREKIAKIVGQKEFARVLRFVSKKGLKKALGGLLTSIAAKTGLKALFTKIGAAIGTALGAVFGPLAPVIGAIVGFLSSFALNALSWLKRKISQNRELIIGGLTMLAGAILLGIPGLVIPGLVLVAGGIFTALGAGTISALGFGGALSAAGGVVSAAIAGFFTFTIGLVAAPIFIISVILVLLTALIIFIINSGAYIVPPQGPETSGFVESAFIQVEKVADPSGPFANNELPLTITYTITVTAKKGTLTNISFSHDCQVIKEGSPPSCSAPTPAAPTLISPVEPFVFTYTQTHPTSFTDSAVVNTFTVVADSPDRARERASASYSVIIGTPPTGCFEFSGFRSDDPDFAKFQAAAGVISSHKAYASKLCSGGPITIERIYSGGGTSACAGAARNSIFFQNCTFYQTRGQAFITYLFAHETGHVYWFRLGHGGFILSGGPPDTEGWLPTYCLTKSDFEDFAETVGDYIDNGALGRLCAAPDQRPFRMCSDPAWAEHCRFAKEVLFQ